MANWLLDYIELTEYIPPEFTNQMWLMRELDLKVRSATNQLEEDIGCFFAKANTLSPKEKQEQYEALLKRYDDASMVSNSKVKMADRLHDLVEKSMRLLDQGLEKLKEDLIEGDKAYIVEDIERRSQELDEQLHLEEANMAQRQHKIRDPKATNNHYHHSKGSHVNNNSTSYHRLQNHHVSHNNHHSIQANHQNHQHTKNTHHNNHYHHNRHRNNSTGTPNSTSTALTPAVKQKKRERKRLNSAMTIFNRNSKTDDDSTNQTTFLSSPTTPDYLANLHSSNSNSLNDVSGGDASCLTFKGMAGNRNSVGPNDKSNGNDPLAKARQPILTAIDAAHAVSPNATNSDKLVLFSNNSNGDNYNNSNYMKDKHIFHQNQMSQLGNHLLPPAGLINSGHNLSNINGNNKFVKGDGNHQARAPPAATSPFASLSRHDPIMMAASQAIHATQNMTPGRRTSSLKASYAAVNSGRLQHPSNSNHSMFDQDSLASEKIYCRCRGAVHDPNMIGCDNGKNCKFEWFHYECVGITTPPPGEWYCDDCRDLPRTLQKQAANSSKHQQSKQITNNPLQTVDREAKPIVE